LVECINIGYVWDGNSARFRVCAKVVRGPAKLSSEPVKSVTISEVLELLRSDVRRVGGQSEWARQKGVPRSQVNRALNRQRFPSTEICDALGHEWAITRGAAHAGYFIILSNRDVILLLRSEVEKFGGVAAWCRQNGLNQPYVSRVLHGRKPASKKLLSALGLSEILVRAAKAKPKSRKQVGGKHRRNVRW
jgi:hypothetical protein